MRYESFKSTICGRIDEKNNANYMGKEPLPRYVTCLDLSALHSEGALPADGSCGLRAEHLSVRASEAKEREKKRETLQVLCA